MSSESNPPAAWQTADARRALRPNGQLYIDLLFDLAGLASMGRPQYPPAFSDGFHSLFQSIDHCYFDQLKRNCLKFYVLLDCDSQQAQTFAQEQFMPKAFLQVTRGYWLADQGQFQAAVVEFCKPGVTADFCSYTIALLAQSAPQELATLVNISQPVISSHVDRSFIVKALASTSSISEAWAWVRRPLDPKETQVEPSNLDDSTSTEALFIPEEEPPISKTELVHSILEVVFGGAGAVRPKAVRALLTLPFDAEEDAAVLSFVTDPPMAISAKSRELLLEFLVTRLTAEGRYIEAYKLLVSASTNGESPEASQRRSLLKKGLRSVMSELDVSVLELDALTTEEVSVAEDHSMAVDIAQHPWAPSVADEPEWPAPQSLPEAEFLAAAKSKATSITALAPRDVPLSASATLRSPAKRFTGSHATIKNVLLATMRSSSSGNLQELTGSPFGTPAKTPRLSGTGSPFIRPPRVSDSPLLSTFGSRQSSPAPTQSTSTERIKVPRIKPTRLQMLELKPEEPSGSPPSDVPFDEPPRQSTPALAKSQNKKRIASQPAELASPPKIQAIEAPPAQQGSWFELTPSRGRLGFPGQFDQDSDDEDDEQADQVPEMVQVEQPATPVSAGHRSTGSSTKPRHIRGQAPEPPTPRRSTRLASREPSAEPSALGESTSSNRASRGRGRGGRKAGRSRRAVNE